ncbi:hypothetical protein A0G03_20220 [Pectobacterium peruviense]|uniref:Uncharacterized protein n=1 Tax=Pectobacterium peruviense TaxID=2066479 RepID=A0ABX4S255_9GAMM|nr:hypothetical protein G033_17120 [Pectobacterium peruviense]PKX84587.1 hypothetical protein A0G03_20220 [Pectobacterium peruviense]
MTPQFDSPLSVNDEQAQVVNKPHDFIIVREIIAAQRHFRDDHHAVPYIQPDEIRTAKAFQAIIPTLHESVLLSGSASQSSP